MCLSSLVDAAAQQQHGKNLFSLFNLLLETLTSKQLVHFVFVFKLVRF